jgi:hypothetical protein
VGFHDRLQQSGDQCSGQAAEVEQVEFAPVERTLLSAAGVLDLGFGFDLAFDFLGTNPHPRVPHLCAFFAQRWDSTTVCSKSGD